MIFDVCIELVVCGILFIGRDIAVSIVVVGNGRTHGCARHLVVNRLFDGGECGEDNHRILLYFEVVSINRSLQLFVVGIEERFFGDEVVRIVVMILTKGLNGIAVHFIIVFRIDLLGRYFGKTKKVAFFTVAESAFIGKLIAQACCPVLLVAAAYFHTAQYITAAGKVESRLGTLVCQIDMSAEGQRYAFKHIGASGKVTVNEQFVRTFTFHNVGVSVAVDVCNRGQCTADTF